MSYAYNEQKNGLWYIFWKIEFLILHLFSTFPMRVDLLHSKCKGILEWRTKNTKEPLNDKPEILKDGKWVTSDFFE